MQWKASERETGLFFVLLQKEPKSMLSMLPRQGRAFRETESSRKGDEMLLFAACKKYHKKHAGQALRPRFKSPVEPLFLIGFPVFDR